jgi:predicted SnoaL-like aldol condensation-catalyzing enzyme
MGSVRVAGSLDKVSKSSVWSPEKPATEKKMNIHGGVVQRAMALIGVAALALLASVHSIAGPAEDAAARNKAVAVAYWNTLNKEGWDAASRYRAPGYHEHSGSSPSGAAELKAYYDSLASREPRHYSAIMRAYADGDMVFLHVHDFPAPGQYGKALMCFLRFEDGKIAEQWTAKQDVPGIRNFNGMF